MPIATGQQALASEQLKLHNASGYLNFAAQTALTIASGVITFTQNWHRVDTEGSAATDDLDTINTGVDGHLLILRPASDARTVVIRHNAGNILCQGENNIILDDIDDWATLIYDGAQSKWLAASGVNEASPAQKMFAFTYFS